MTESDHHKAVTRRFPSTGATMTDARPCGEPTIGQLLCVLKKRLTSILFVDLFACYPGVETDIP